MIRHSLAGLCRRLASWLEPSPIEEAIRRADDARAIRMEFERQMRVRRVPRLRTSSGIGGKGDRARREFPIVRNKRKARRTSTAFLCCVVRSGKIWRHDDAVRATFSLPFASLLLSREGQRGPA
jgi:hypothetical protein